MAKRLTDTDKWKKPWFRKLPVHYKSLWCYILDTCDMAGVWDVDIEAAGFHIGYDFIEAEVKAVFDKQIQAFKPHKWWVVDFILFQYGTLSETCKPHTAVVSLLKKHTLWIDYTKSIHTLKDKDKDKDKDKEGDCKGEQKKFKEPTVDEIKAYCLERKNNVNPEKWLSHYQAKDWFIGKNKMKDWKAAVRTWETDTVSATQEADRDKLKRDLKQAYQDRQTAQGFLDSCEPEDKRYPELKQRITLLTRKIETLEGKINV